MKHESLSYLQPQCETAQVFTNIDTEDKDKQGLPLPGIRPRPVGLLPLLPTPFPAQPLSLVRAEGKGVLRCLKVRHCLHLLIVLLNGELPISLVPCLCPPPPPSKAPDSSLESTPQLSQAPVYVVQSCRSQGGAHRGLVLTHALPVCSLI